MGTVALTVAHYEEEPEKVDGMLSRFESRFQRGEDEGGGEEPTVALAIAENVPVAKYKKAITTFKTKKYGAISIYFGKSELIINGISGGVLSETTLRIPAELVQGENTVVYATPQVQIDVLPTLSKFMTVALSNDKGSLRYEGEMGDISYGALALVNVTPPPEFPDSPVPVFSEVKGFLGTGKVPRWRKSNQE